LDAQSMKLIVSRIVRFCSKQFPSNCLIATGLVLIAQSEILASKMFTDPHNHLIANYSFLLVGVGFLLLWAIAGYRAIMRQELRDLRLTRMSRNRRRPKADKSDLSKKHG
jgi:hypothetical protein